MRVEKISREKEVKKHEYTGEELNKEISFYIADKISQDLFLYGDISIEEYRQIRKKNIENFQPFLAKIMI